MLADPVQIAVRVANALAGAGVTYLIGGSLASSQYGIPRSTPNVDLIADLQPQHVAPLGVLKVQAGALETDYLRHWASQIGLTELLDRALSDAGVTL